MLPFPLRVLSGVDRDPWGTILLIAANVAVHAMVVAGAIADPEAGILQWGAVEPAQWLTSVFRHGGWLHLGVNMLFLWVFGMVAEGLLGWARFLAFYAGTAAASGALEQGVMLALGRTEGASLGASGVIYGLMVATLFWAPKTRIFCTWSVGLSYRALEVPLGVIATLYVLYDVLDAVAGGTLESTPALHLMGGAAGAALGLVFMAARQVDTGGWDLFTLWRRRRLF